MKVCHFTSVHGAGDGRIFNRECTSLAQNGFDVYLVVRGKDAELNGVHIVGAGEPNKNRLMRMLFWAKRVYKKALSIDADIYHFHDPELLGYGLKLAKRGKIVIFDSHENHTLQIKQKHYIPASLRNIAAKCYERYETRVVKQLSAVITPCTFNGKNLFERRAKVITCIANYPRRFAQGEMKRIPHDEFTGCYTGSLTESRGIRNIILASYKAGTKLILAGSFTPESFGEEMRSRKEFACVDYRGVLPHERVYDIYREADFGFSTTLSVGQYGTGDSLATKVFEYFESGIPAVLKTSNTTKRLNDAYHFAVLADAKDVNSVSDAILYLKEHPEEATRMGANGKKLVETEMNWETEQKKLVTLYNSLMISR